jgi:hypothetical protein
MRYSQAMPLQTRPRPTRLEWLHFTNPLELIRPIVKTVFGEPLRIPRASALLKSDTLYPWCRYLQPRHCPIRRKFTSEERQRARGSAPNILSPAVGQNRVTELGGIGPTQSDPHLSPQSQGSGARMTFTRRDGVVSLRNYPDWLPSRPLCRDEPEKKRPTLYVSRGKRRH